MSWTQQCLPWAGSREMWPSLIGPALPQAGLSLVRPGAQGRLTSGSLYRLREVHYKRREVSSENATMFLPPSRAHNYAVVSSGAMLDTAHIRRERTMSQCTVTVKQTPDLTRKCCHCTVVICITPTVHFTKSQNKTTDTI